MNNPTVSALVVLASVLALVGCWKQQDVVTIKSDGHTNFRSEVVITEKGFSFKDVDQLTNEFSKTLTTRGWKVEKRWLSRSEPFALVFTGEGNIHKVGSATDFYRLRKIDEKTYEISFSPAEAKGGKSSRRMKFERSFLGGAPRLIDESGKEVKEIENVLGTNKYKLVF